MTTLAPDHGDIVVLERFIEATRDSGYKSTAAAVSELVDNAVDAGATRVEVRIAADADDEEWPLTLTVLDDGSGMGASALRRALGFGGSSRFNQRGGLGRYGMGLPNGSVSQARRVTVHSWEAGGPVRRCHLDVDEIAQGVLRRVPDPVEDELPLAVSDWRTDSGTVVRWSRCDRLENKRPTTIARKLHVFLGRVFRHYIWEGNALLVNGQPVVPVDPLFLQQHSRTRGGSAHGDVLRRELRAPDGSTGTVEVRFSQLPIREWFALDNKQKRALGVTNGAGVSVVRGNREIDYGWHFFRKRRENYDDWWRCEVRFPASLDEHFGITHTKQQVSPTDALLSVLQDDLDAIARDLNRRARSAYTAAKAAAQPTSASGSGGPPAGALLAVSAPSAAPVGEAAGGPVAAAAPPRSSGRGRRFSMNDVHQAAAAVCETAKGPEQETLYKEFRISLMQQLARLSDGAPL